MIYTTVDEIKDLEYGYGQNVAREIDEIRKEDDKVYFRDIAVHHGLHATLDVMLRTTGKKEALEFLSLIMDKAVEQGGNYLSKGQENMVNMIHDFAFDNRKKEELIEFYENEDFVLDNYVAKAIDKFVKYLVTGRKTYAVVVACNIRDSGLSEEFIDRQFLSCVCPHCKGKKITDLDLFQFEEEAM